MMQIRAMDASFPTVLGSSVGPLQHFEHLVSRGRYCCLVWYPTAAHPFVSLSLIVQRVTGRVCVIRQVQSSPTWNRQLEIFPEFVIFTIDKPL